MSSEQKRIVWMMDESLADSNPQNWERIRELYRNLIGLIGNNEFNHVLADPVPSFHNLAEQLKEREFSAIIDLTGWSRAFFEELFPDTPIIDDFGMSRIRDVSDPDLTTTGHLLKVTPERVEAIKREQDLSQILIFDDVSFSGGTGVSTANILEVNGSTTHAYLIANTGDCPALKGATRRLEELGHEVLFGYEMDVPQDDGWHLKDLHMIQRLDEAFPLALQLLDLFLDENKNGLEIKQFLSNPGNLEVLFPRRYTSNQIRDLYQQGRFMLANGEFPRNGSVHAGNPVLWASKYPMGHIDVPRLIEQQDEVCGLLRRLNGFLVGNEKVKQEVDFELARIARRYK